MTRFLMTLAYWLLVMPVASLWRLLGGSFLQVGKDPKRKSYWIERSPPELESYRKQS